LTRGLPNLALEPTAPKNARAAAQRWSLD